MNITIDVDDFARSLDGLGRRFGVSGIKAIDAAVDAADHSAKNTTLFVTRRPNGGTRSTIRGMHFGYYGALSASGVAEFLEYGTRPHGIDARNAPFLVFQVNGQWMRTKHVNHPGTAPRPFMEEAAHMGEQILIDSLEHYSTEAIRLT